MSAYRSAAELGALNVHKQVADEIQRFESVHPFIYRAYDLINKINDTTLREQLETELVSIENAFISSQEWVLTRNVTSIRLGVVGSLDSSKTALIHRYLTGGYRTQDSAEGGRFKKDITIDDRCYLLLIRDEGVQPPDLLFTHWFDGVLVVFSVYNRCSFDVAKHHLHLINDYRRNNDFPIFVVGTQDPHPPAARRTVSEDEAKQYAAEKNCVYIEVSSTTGNKVESVFRNVCKSIILAQSNALISYRRDGRPLPGTPSNTYSASKPRNRVPIQIDYAGSAKSKRTARTANEHPTSTSMSAAPAYEAQAARHLDDPAHSFNNQFHGTADAYSDHSYRHPAADYYHSRHAADDTLASRPHRMYSSAGPSSDRFYEHNAGVPCTRSVSSFNDSDLAGRNSKMHPPPLPTPTTTPTGSRKPNRLYNIWRSKDSHKDLGVGQLSNVAEAREILKQGYLYKRGNARITWKKKYVCLFENGYLCYFDNAKAFHEQSSQAKEVFLGLAMVRVNNTNAARNRRSSLLNVFKYKEKENMLPTNALTNSVSSIAPASATDRVSIASDTAVNGGGTASTPGEESSGGGMSDAELAALAHDTFPMPSTDMDSKRKKKKHHRRIGSFGVRPNDDDEDIEFEILTSDQRRLEFSANTSRERDEWVTMIGQQIAKALMSQHAESRDGRPMATRSDIEDILNIIGNEACADCGARKPSWAVCNFGITICIECSGMHRKLGTHVSKVRSLDLDQWPIEYVSIMKRIGNRKANLIWEKNLPPQAKIDANVTTSRRERFIENKWVNKAYLAPPPSGVSLNAALAESIRRKNMDQFVRTLASCSKNDVDAADGFGRTPAHLAAMAQLPEFLLLLAWNRASLKLEDFYGKMPLDYARANGTLNSHLLGDLVRPNSRADGAASSSSAAASASTVSLAAHRLTGAPPGDANCCYESSSSIGHIDDDVASTTTPAIRKPPGQLPSGAQ